MTRRYYYHEHEADYAEVKAKGLKARGELYGDPNDFEDFSSKPFLEAILPLLDLRPDARILELGCGTGPGACYLAGKGFHVDGIDLIPAAIETAREIAEDLNLTVGYEVMDVCNLPVQGEAFDLIVDSYSTQGIVKEEDRERMFRAVKGRLSKQGYFLLSCCVFEPDRENSEIRIKDSETGRVYTRFDKRDLYDIETEICYSLWRHRDQLPDAKPEDYDGTICINNNWYIHRRLYRTHQNLRVELESYELEVIFQGGDVMENAVCVHKGSAVTLNQS